MLVVGESGLLLQPRNLLLEGREDNTSRAGEVVPASTKGRHLCEGSAGSQGQHREGGEGGLHGVAVVVVAFAFAVVKEEKNRCFCDGLVEKRFVRKLRTAQIHQLSFCRMFCT